MISTDLSVRLRGAGILPVITVHDVEATLSLIEALARGGIRGVEIVMRTERASSAIEAIKRRFPQLLLAAGTVVTAALLEKAADAGADFVISPGMPSELLGHPRLAGTPLVPGALTPTEVLDALSKGFRIVKYYPAVAFSGVDVLADYANVFPEVEFMPTGKISMGVLDSYMGLPNVVCVGGSWMYSGALEEVESKVRQALALVDAARARHADEAERRVIV